MSMFMYTLAFCLSVKGESCKHQIFVTEIQRVPIIHFKNLKMWPGLFEWSHIRGVEVSQKNK